MQKNTDTLCTTQWQMNLTMSLLQNIPTFDGWDTTKLEDWLSNIKTVADLLKESQACLAIAKSHGLTHTLICEALQAEKCWDNIKEYFIWNFAMQIYTHTHHISWKSSKGTIKP